MSEYKKSGGSFESILFGKNGLFEKESFLEKSFAQKKDSFNYEKKDLKVKNNYETVSPTPELPKTNYKKQFLSEFEMTAFCENKEYVQFKAKIQTKALILDTCFDQDKVCSIYNQTVQEHKALVKFKDFCIQQNESLTKLYFANKKIDLLTQLLLKSNLKIEMIKEISDFDLKIKKLKEQFDSNNITNNKAREKGFETKESINSKINIKSESFDTNIKKADCYYNRIPILGGKDKKTVFEGINDRLNSLQSIFYSPRKKEKLLDGRTKVTRPKIKKTAVALAAAGLLAISTIGYKLNLKKVYNPNTPLTQTEIDYNVTIQEKLNETKMHQEETKINPFKNKIENEKIPKMPTLTPQARKSIGNMDYKELNKILKI